MLENESEAQFDWELAASAARGDEDGFAKLIERNQQSVHRFVFQFVRHEETARDLAQEVFVKAWFALPRVRRGGRFSTWLYQIAMNVCRDHVRSKAAKNMRLTDPIEQYLPRGSAFERPLVSSDLGPDRLMEQAEEVAVIERVIHGLPRKLCEAFLLGVVEGHSAKEVGRILGVSAKSVETRISRARQVLAGRLDQHNSR